MRMGRVHAAQLMLSRPFKSTKAVVRDAREIAKFCSDRASELDVVASKLACCSYVGVIFIV